MKPLQRALEIQIEKVGQHDDHGALGVDALQEAAGAFEVGHAARAAHGRVDRGTHDRSEEHTSELQSQFHLVCRLLLEKKNKIYTVVMDYFTSSNDMFFSRSPLFCDA